jgi:hypothetical protein
VPTGVGEVPQILGRFPDRQIHDHAVVVEHPDRGGVAVLGLQARDESRAAVSERVDRVEEGQEVRELRRSSGARRVETFSWAR